MNRRVLPLIIGSLLLPLGCGGNDDPTGPTGSSFSTLSVTTASLPNALPSLAYSETLVATGGDGSYTWALSGGTLLPTGLSLATNGAIMGTPTGASSTFTVEATSGDGQTATQQLTITINVAITTTSLPNALPTVAYSETLAATGGDSDYTWSVTVGSLPTGLSLATSTGLISGAATGASSTFTVQVASGDGQTATQTFSITVGLAVTTTSLPNAAPSVAYSETLAATGGDSDYTWSVTVGSLPTGLSLATNGAITGTPTGASSTFTVEATSGDGQTATQQLTITINATVAITTASLPDGVENVDYGTETLTATGGDGSYTWAPASGSGPLPTGLSLATNGDVSGKPTVVGSSVFTVEVTSGDGQTSQQGVSVTVNQLVLEPSELCSDNPATAIPTFEDSRLEALIRWALSIGSQDALTCNLLSSITELNAWNAGQLGRRISLVGIQNLTGLANFSVGGWGGGITDISALSGLTSLTSLDLSGPFGGVGTVSDFSWLSGLTSLTELGLGGNIPDISVLSGLTSLTILRLQHTAITDISALSGLTSLRSLTLRDNPISDISALSGLTSLTGLDLFGNSISDISALSGLTSLTGLNLDFNSITDISALSGLTSLMRLRLHRNVTKIGIDRAQLTDISALSGLTSLTFLDLSDNSITDIQPLLDNTGLGAGDLVYLGYNLVSCADVAALQAKGVSVSSDCP